MRPRVLAWLFLLGLVSCREVTNDLASDPQPALPDAGRDAGPGSHPDAATPGVDAASGMDAGAHVRTTCSGHVCACDDGVDSDSDGLVDGLDPECTGPFDDDEHSFGTGAPIPLGACRDCFWDDNGGSGDDQCRYPEECLEGAAPPGKGACGSCEVSPTCVSACQARTPNGCDCFGCCAIERADGSVLHVALRDSCALDKLGDAEACPRCVQDTQCMNPCGRCELCAGRTVADLPADCSSGKPGAATSYACENGEVVCSATAPCSDRAYCQLGCCLPTVF